jgi:hypothetical protein
MVIVSQHTIPAGREESKMSILTYTNELFANLERDLNLVDMNDGNRLIQLETAFMMVYKTVEKMKIYLDRYSFQDQEEEVLFFKNFMPKLLSRSIYYSELFNQISLPRRIDFTSES